MGELEDYIGRALRLKRPSFQRGVETDAGQLDLLVRDGDRTFVCEIKAATGTVESMGRIHLVAQYPDLLGAQRPPGEVTAVVVAPSWARNVEALAQRIGILTVTAPMGLLRNLTPESAPITTPKAWNVVTEIIRMGFNPGVRQLAKASGTSTGWTSGIVRSLQARGIIEGDGSLRDTGILLLLDRVANERPLDSLRRVTFSTSLANWEDADEALRRHWPEIIGRLNPPDFYRCGQTAAMIHVDHILRHDAVQLYARDSATLRYFFEGEQPGEHGVQFIIYEPDRNMEDGAQGKGPKRYVSLSQTLLDVAGMGYAARDTALKLVEALHSGH